MMIMIIKIINVFVICLIFIPWKFLIDTPNNEYFCSSYPTLEWFQTIWIFCLNFLF